MDILTPAERSAQMRRIVKWDTTPERVVRRAAHRLGARFRLHRRDLPGTPEIVPPGRRQAILVHGCFWHQHPGCRLARQPKSRPDYWLPKLARNIERDRENEARLRALGWDTLIVWECETKDAEQLDAILRGFLKPRPDRAAR